MTSPLYLGHGTTTPAVDLDVLLPLIKIPVQVGEVGVVDTSWGPGVDRRYGATGVGDDHLALNNCLASAFATGHDAIFTFPTYNVGSDATRGLLLPAGGNVRGWGRQVRLNYSGPGWMIDGYTNAWSGAMKDVYAVASHDAATGIKLGNGCRYPRLKRFMVQGTNALSTTGIGFDCDAGPAWSAYLQMFLCTSIGFKYPMKLSGVGTGGAFWTAITGMLVELLGRSNGHIPGSIGLWIDANTSPEAMKITGLIIEAVAKKWQFDNTTGLTPLSLEGGFEGNDDDGLPSFPVNFAGDVQDPHSSFFYRALANGAANRWSAERMYAGTWDTWSRYGKVHHFFANGGILTRFGADLLPGDDPNNDQAGATDGFIVSLGGVSNTTSRDNWMALRDRKITWESQIPSSATQGDYAQGSVVWNSAAAVGQPKGWQCTVPGTFLPALVGVTGSITINTPTLTVNNISTIAKGNYITIAGVTGTKHVLSVAGNVVTLNSNADATVAGAAVAYATPTFVSMGNL